MIRTVCMALMISLLLTSCVKQQILDRVHLFIVASFDEISKDQIELTIAVPDFELGKPEAVTDQMYSKTGRTGSEIREVMGTQIDKPLHPGKLSVVLFGRDKATSGVKKELDVLLRNAIHSRRMYLAVVDGKAKHLLEEKFSRKDEKGMYLYHLLDANTRKGTLPSQNLHEFEYARVGKGLDPYLPLLQIQHGRVSVVGTALFRDDAYVASLNYNQSKFMKMLLKDMNQGIIEVKLDNGTFLTVDNVGSSVKYHMKNDSILINLSMDCKIREAEGNPISDEVLPILKKQIEQKILQAESELIQIFQKNEIDPLGLGDFVRSRKQTWNEEEWMRQYPKMNIEVDVDVIIMETGIKK
ncbi:Ger(x)C family spore germination protein [Paenibacillus sp. BK720]|uniref:Ger(x)C family spore germination protein n=1 Tax=Paenibacillus sp. BK720 TaxID=2587092 RepID=UPI003267AF74